MSLGIGVNFILLDSFSDGLLHSLKTYYKLIWQLCLLPSFLWLMREFKPLAFIYFSFSNDMRTKSSHGEYKYNTGNY